MEKTDQEAKQRVEAAREKRKQKILAGSQKRMTKILGVAGGSRQAPCVEGMNTASGSDSAPESPKPIKRTPSQPKMQEPLDFEQDDNGPALNLADFIATPPKYMEFVDKYRFWFAIELGLLFAVLTLFFDQIGSVIVPTLALVISYEAFVFKTRKALCPKQSPMVSTILPAGFNMDSVNTFGLIADIFRKAIMDLMLVGFGFISSRLILDTFAGLLIADI